MRRRRVGREPTSREKAVRRERAASLNDLSRLLYLPAAVAIGGELRRGCQIPVMDPDDISPDLENLRSIGEKKLGFQLISSIAFEILN